MAGVQLGYSKLQRERFIQSSLPRKGRTSVKSLRGHVASLRLEEEEEEEGCEVVDRDGRERFRLKYVRYRQVE